jgi:hypothetical protein
MEVHAMRPRIRPAAILLALVLAAWIPSAQAVMVTYEFSGTLDTRSPGGDPLHYFDGIVLGMPFAGVLAYDAAVYDPVVLSPESVLYFGGPGSRLTLTLGDATLASVSPPWIYAHNDHPSAGWYGDSLTFEPPVSYFTAPGVPTLFIAGPYSFGMWFLDRSGTALASTAIPPTLDLARFPDAHRVSATLGYPGGGYVYIAGDIQELHSVPEPASLLLLVSGLLGLGGMAWRRQRRG